MSTLGPRSRPRNVAKGAGTGTEVLQVTWTWILGIGTDGFSGATDFSSSSRNAVPARPDSRSIEKNCSRGVEDKADSSSSDEWATGTAKQPICRYSDSDSPRRSHVLCRLGPHSRTGQAGPRRTKPGEDAVRQT